MSGGGRNPTPQSVDDLLVALSRDLNRGQRDIAASTWRRVLDEFTAMRTSPLYARSESLDALGRRLHDVAHRMRDILGPSAGGYYASSSSNLPKEIFAPISVRGGSGGGGGGGGVSGGGDRETPQAGPMMSPVRHHPRPTEEEQMRVLREEMNSRASMREEEGEQYARAIKPPYSPYANDERIFGEINGGVGRPAPPPAAGNNHGQQQHQQHQHQHPIQDHDHHRHGEVGADPAGRSPSGTASQYSRADSQASHYTATGSAYGSMHPPSPGEPGARGLSHSSKRRVAPPGGRTDSVDLGHDPNAPLAAFSPKKKQIQGPQATIVLRDDAEPIGSSTGKKHFGGSQAEESTRSYSGDSRRSGSSSMGDFLRDDSPADRGRHGKRQVANGPKDSFNLNPSLDAREGDGLDLGRRRRVERPDAGSTLLRITGDGGANGIGNGNGVDYPSGASSKRINVEARRGVLNSAMQDTSAREERVGKKMTRAGSAGAESRKGNFFTGEAPPGQVDNDPRAVQERQRMELHRRNGGGNPANKSSQMSQMLERPVEPVIVAKGESTMAKLGLERSGLQPLGIEDREIADTSMSASSSYTRATGPEAARLNADSAWIADHLDGNQYLQIDLGAVCDISLVATQGAPHRRYQYWLSGYRVRYTDPSTGGWRSICDDLGHEIVHRGNTDTSTIAITDLTRVHGRGGPIRTQHVRIYANNWNNGIGLRCELFGVRGSSQGHPPQADAKRSGSSMSHDQFARPKLTDEYDPYSKRMSHAPRASLGKDVERLRQTAGTYSQFTFG